MGKAPIQSGSRESQVFMKPSTVQPLIATVKERCRVCYTCVRECPTKAIRITAGQAEVLVERCIGCGNCFRVCSQHAKRILSFIPNVQEMLHFSDFTAACLAPSFPAHFGEMDYHRVVGLVRALGFNAVYEVAFGADLVAARYRQLLAEASKARYIAANCPALVEYVERFHPDLVPYLAPVASPMLAMARVVRQIHGPNARVVFIGPCIAKKAETDARYPVPEVDAAITFIEFEQLLAAEGIDAGAAAPSEFDPPRSGIGGLFPISRGMLQAAHIDEDLMAGEVVAADGRKDFVEAIKEFASGALDARLLEVLCCSGCIMGPGIGSDLPLFTRRALVGKYVRQRADTDDVRQYRRWVERYGRVDLSRAFCAKPLNLRIPCGDSIDKILQRMGKVIPTDELNCGACGYDSCRDHAAAIELGLAESETCLPYTIEQLKKTLQALAQSKEELADMHAALVQSEKLASMGQLAAAIAHEINNPLGVVLMYAHLLYDESKDDPGLGPKLGEDLKMIAEQTQRCKKIVAGLLDFARQNKMARQPTDVNELVRRGLQAMVPSAGIEIDLQDEMTSPIADLDQDQILQVLVNLVGNAFEAMSKGGELRIRTWNEAGSIQISIADTGIGIPKENLGKIFEPFFTTKQIGKGTGLGLAVSYGIIKMHHGNIQVVSNTDAACGPVGTVFTITLPQHNPQE
jgi:two-component system NtrC family sensor kinase